MDRLGRFALLLSLVLAGYGIVSAFIGARRANPVLVESARRTAFALFAAVVAANGALLLAILSNDFAVRYVAENSSRETPTFFKVLSLWSADDGSLMLWNLVLAGYLAAVALRFRRYRPETLPYALGVMYSVAAFYLLLVSGPTRPFATLASVPADGRGPLPLLQNHPLMAVHPPFLYLGFIGFTVPFAFAMATLLSGATSDHWVGLMRRWTLAVWCFLGVGLLLGGLWSYSVLGWGGYWAWDPVENVALLPWLTATAFLHSVMLQERRGMLKVWNLGLAIGAFALTTFGTFLTRGSILASVHTFAQSAVGPLYLGFLLLVLAVGFGLLVSRAPQLRTPGRVDSLLSRESLFVGNNLALLTVTLIVLAGTIFPLFVEATSNAQVTVGGPYFRHTTAPVFLVLLLLVGVAPVLSWRGGSVERVRRRLLLPAGALATVVLTMAAFGVRNLLAVTAFGLAAFLAVANGGELVSGLRAGARAGAGPAPVRVLRALLRGRRRNGGLVVHLGLAVVAVAVTVSTNFAQQTEVTLNRGQHTIFAGYTMTYSELRTHQQPQRVVLTTDLAVTRGQQAHGLLKPSLNLYPAAAEPIGTPSIQHGLGRDLYASVIGVDKNGAQATFRFFLNPGVTWLWFGGVIMVLGGLLAAWPARRRTSRVVAAPARRREGARALAGAGKP